MYYNRLMLKTNEIPLSLYVHFPWCVKKCPYCDFNSHTLPSDLPAMAYVDALLSDAQQHRDDVDGRLIHSVFMGGGTPSLFAPSLITTLLTQLREIMPFAPYAEVTLEANPGATDASYFAGFYEAGITRLSIGVQSFNDHHLGLLGRIHSAAQAKEAITQAQAVGFDSINVDVMFGLPEQSLAQALDDLTQAIALQPEHISWYQLTLEPNTYFHRFPPDKMPCADTLWQIQQAGQALLHQAGYLQYEVSAYTRSQQPSQHNLNYWHYGDYIGIGAGAHGKVSHPQTKRITRHQKIKHPATYLKAKNPCYKQTEVAKSERPFEFMLKALRLNAPLPWELFERHTYLDKATLQPIVTSLTQQTLVTATESSLSLTDQGRRYLNDVVAAFLVDSTDSAIGGTKGVLD